MSLFPEVGQADLGKTARPSVRAKVRCPGAKTRPAQKPIDQAQGARVDFKSLAIGGGGIPGLLSQVCTVSLPVTVGPGEQFSPLTGSLKGHAKLAKGAKATIRVERLIVGRKSEAIEQTFTIEEDGEFAISLLEATNWSKCGTSGTARLQLSVRIEAEKKLSRTKSEIILDELISQAPVRSCS